LRNECGFGFQSCEFLPCRLAQEFLHR
jgi:hypothetical protein